MGNLRLKTIQSLILFSLSLPFLVGCQKTPVEEVTCVMPEWANTPNNDVRNPQLKVSINVDGSDSMLGYVTIPNSNYARAIEVLSSIILESSDVSVEYKRIGDNKTITRTNFRQDAKSPAFYSTPEPTYDPVNSPIQVAITPPPQGKEKLTVIITDLEADDPGKVAEALSKNYLHRGKRNYTVGIWAVRSQFNGTVFNPNTGRAKYVYNTEGKPKEAYRPFYVLFIGEYDKIKQYFDDIRRIDPQLQEYSEMFIFPTRNILKEPINLGNFSRIKQNSILPETGDLRRVFSLSDGRVVVTHQDQNKDSYDLIELLEPTENQLKITYSVPFPQLATQNNNNNNSLLINEDNLSTKTRVFIYGEKASQNIETHSDNTTESESQELEADNQDSKSAVINTREKQNFVENTTNTLRQALIIDNLKLDEQKQNLEFIANLNLNNLSTPQIYLFEVDLILNDITGLDWWNDWSVAIGEGTNGAKTQGLSVFMNRLKSLSLDTLKDGENQAVIGRFCIGIQKN